MGNLRESQNDLNAFYLGLKDLVESTFPKTCKMCGRVYKSKQEFLEETVPVRNISLEDSSGLFEIEEDDLSTAIGVFRNCKCGTTLMADFKDRRDDSELGRSNRKKFEKLINILIDNQLEYDTARSELLKVLHGKHSEIIKKVLGNIKFV